MEERLAAVDALVERLAALEAWLRTSAADALRGQHHLDQDRPERAYWHSGYHTAMVELLPLITGSAAAHRNAGTSNPILMDGLDEENCLEA